MLNRENPAVSKGVGNTYARGGERGVLKVRSSPRRKFMLWDTLLSFCRHTPCGPTVKQSCWVLVADIIRRTID